MASSPVPRISEEEYLRIEREAFEKSEFHDGEIFAMSGGTNNHSFLGAQMLALLGRQLPAGCRLFNGDLRIKVAGRASYLYADAGLVCGPAQVTDPYRDNLLNPHLIVEVLSPSTENYDRGPKFEIYRQIPTFCEYILVSQDRAFVEHWSKQSDGGWLMREYSGLDAVVTIPRFTLVIGLSQLYSVADDVIGGN